MTGECKTCGDSITYSDGAWRHSNGSAFKDGHQAIPKS